MRRISYEPVAQLGKTLGDMLKRWPWALLVVGLDFLFLFVFSFVYTLYFQKIMVHINIILQQTPMVASAMQTQDIYAAAPIAQTLMKEVFEIKKIAVMIAISTFVIWLAVQAFSWCAAFRVSGQKTKYIQYIKTFSIFSAIWVAIVSFVAYLSIDTFFNKAIAFSATKGDAALTATGVLISLAAVGYFALVSFSLTGKVKEVFRKFIMLSFLRSKVIVAYLFLVAIAIAINSLLIILFRLSAVASFIVGLVLVILLLVYARTYMINVVQSIEENDKKYEKDNKIENTSKSKSKVKRKVKKKRKN